MFSNLTGLSVCSCWHSPPHQELAPSSALLFLLIPLPLFWCTWLYSKWAELIAILAKIYFSLSTFYCYHAMPALCLDFCIRMWKQDPTLSHSGRILFHLCTLSLALGESAISLPCQLMKVHLFHQEVFSETAQIFTCSFSCKIPIGWLYW